MYILGVSAFYHDSAACIVKGGQVLAAAQEERFTRIKHDKSFPQNAIKFCLDHAGISVKQLDLVVYYESSNLKFDRMLKTFVSYAPRGCDAFAEAIPLWLRERLNIKKLIAAKLEFKGEIFCAEHHLSHAASAFFPSPYTHSAILTMDGVGEWATTSFGIGEDNSIDLSHELHFPHSLGLLYSAFTFFCGFKVNSGEYKLMGLAPFGNPTFTSIIRDHLVDVKDDGSFQLNLAYFDFAVGKQMTNDKFSALFSVKKRDPEAEISQDHADLAASIQQITEEIVLRIARTVKKQTGVSNLCLSGGVALNCVSNGKLYREGVFENIWTQPASGDAGSSLGAALYGWHVHKKQPRRVRNKFDGQCHSLLGPSYSNDEIEIYLTKMGYPYRKIPQKKLEKELASLLSSGKIIALMRGRMEFGPRALGSRSILADARSETMQKELNLKTKFRESFRPFAPLVLAEEVENWFDVYGTRKQNKGFCSPYMLNVSELLEERRIQRGAEISYSIDKRLSLKRSEIPAVTHVDYSARIQTVHREISPFLYGVLKRFHELTKVPVLINTSFNVRNEPIVLDYKDAYKCFMRTNIDYLVLENCLLAKSDQPEWSEQTDWKTLFSMD